MIKIGKVSVISEDEEFYWLAPHHLTVIEFKSFEPIAYRYFVETANTVSNDEVFILTEYEIIVALSKEDATAMLLNLPPDLFKVSETYSSVLEWHKHQ